MAIKIHERLQQQLLDTGVSPDEVGDMATNLLRKHNILEDNEMKLTSYGETRNNMSPADRAIDRAVKYSGNNADEYVYNPDTNIARLKKFQKGGKFEGPSHKKGGIPIEVEGDEIVINSTENKAAIKHEHELLALNENPDDWEIIPKIDARKRSN